MKQGGSILGRGVVAGLLGAATVAVWFFILDFAGGHPFRTPAALGYALLFGGGHAANEGLSASAPQSIEISARVVLAYTLVHVLAFMLAGFVFVWIAEQVERRPSLLLLAGLTLVLLEAVALVNFASGAQWNLGTIGIGSVVVANILAVAVMTWYVWRTHPALRQRLRTNERPGDEPAGVRV